MFSFFFSAVQILIFHIFICVLKIWFSFSGRLVKILLVEVIVSSDKWIKMVNFKHSIEMWKVNWSDMTRAWDKDEFDSADLSRMQDACHIFILSFFIPLGSSWSKGRPQCCASGLCWPQSSLLYSSWCLLSSSLLQLTFSRFWLVFPPSFYPADSISRPAL